MDTNIVVPAGFGVHGFVSDPVNVYDMASGLGVLIGSFPKVVNVKPSTVERELLFRSEVEFQNFELKDLRGLEVVDPTPVELPLRLAAAPSLRDQVVEQISRYLSARAKDEGFESLEEAMDFDLDAELDDLQTLAEGTFLQSFMPHEGRAVNTPNLKRDEKPVDKKQEMPVDAPDVPVDPAP